MDESLACKCNFIKHLVNNMHLQIKTKEYSGLEKQYFLL